VRVRELKMIKSWVFKSRFLESYISAARTWVLLSSVLNQEVNLVLFHGEANPLKNGVWRMARYSYSASWLCGYIFLEVVSYLILSEYLEKGLEENKGPRTFMKPLCAITMGDPAGIGPEISPQGNSSKDLPQCSILSSVMPEVLEQQSGFCQYSLN